MRGSDTDDIIRDIFRSFLLNYQEELKIIKGSDFVFESAELMDYKLHRVRLRTGGSYIKSPEWLANKKGTIYPENYNDNECLRWSTISALNYNEIMKKEFENIFKKIKHEDKDFSSQKRDWENFEQNNEPIALNVLFASQNSEEVTLAYKSKHNYNRENSTLLLMINDDEKYYYFAVKSKLELYSSEWLRSKKESITNEDNCFQNALNDALDYQRIKKDPQEISKLQPYVNQCILLMVTDDGERWHYLAVRSLPALLTGISSSNNGDFYCLNCFHSYRTLNKLKKHERVCNNHDYCRIDMPEEHEKIKYLPGEKSLKVPFIIYADLVFNMLV